MCSTFAAVSTLAILRRRPEFLNTEKMNDFLHSLRVGDGSFRTTPSVDSEADVRATYCAVAIARLCGFHAALERQPGHALFNHTAEYLASLQTYEGGFAGERWEGSAALAEAHAGFTYCAVAALRLLNHGKGWDEARAARWAASLQKEVEGGFAGRINKLVVGQ